VLECMTVERTRTIRKDASHDETVAAEQRFVCLRKRKREYRVAKETGGRNKKGNMCRAVNTGNTYPGARERIPGGL